MKRTEFVSLALGLAIVLSMCGIEKYVAADPLPLELKAKWSFETDGSDSVGDNDLTLEDEATIASGGKMGNGLSLSTSYTEGYAWAAASADLNVAQQFSAATWVKYASDCEMYPRIMARIQDDDNGFNIALDGRASDTMNVCLRVEYEGITYLVEGAGAYVDYPLVQDTYHHIAFAFDALAGTSATDKFTLWIDGDIYPLEDGAGGIQSELDGSLLVGRGTNVDNSNFSGMLDEMCFYHGLLTQSEVDSLVPEPGSLVLLGSLIAAMAFRAIRKKH